MLLVLAWIPLALAVSMSYRLDRDSLSVRLTHTSLQGSTELAYMFDLTESCFVMHAPTLEYQVVRIDQVNEESARDDGLNEALADELKSGSEWSQWLKDGSTDKKPLAAYAMRASVWMDLSDPTQTTLRALVRTAGGESELEYALPPLLDRSACNQRTIRTLMLHYYRGVGAYTSAQEALEYVRVALVSLSPFACLGLVLAAIVVASFGLGRIYC